MNTIIMGTALAGALILTIILYVSIMILLFVKGLKNHLPSDSMGTADLPHQEYNYAWQRFVMHK